jgi:hypothetical protein
MFNDIMGMLLGSFDIQGGGGVVMLHRGTVILVL